MRYDFADRIALELHLDFSREFSRTELRWSCIWTFLGFGGPNCVGAAFGLFWDFADRIALELHLDFSFGNFFAARIALELHVDFPPGDGFFRGGAPGFRSPARGAEVGHRGRLGGVGEWFDS